MNIPGKSSFVAHNSIREKLRQLVLLSVAGALLTVAVLTLAYQGWRFTNTMIQRMAVVAQMVSVNVAASLEFADERQAEKLLHSLRADQEIISAVVLSENRELFAGYGPGIQKFSSGNDWLHQAVSGNQPTHRLNLSSFEYIAPVVLHNETIGYLYLTSSLDNYYRQFLLLAVMLAGISLVAGWLTLGWTRVLQKRIVEPIYQLAKITGRVSEERDFSLRAPKADFDEISTLTDGFNTMLGELELRDRALKAALSEANEARITAEAASSAKSQFLATMSHEIRTPMNGVLGMTELLLASGLGDEQRRHAEAVMRSGKHLLSIINDILDFSKIESGHMTLENVAFDLTLLIRETLNMFTHPASEKGVTLSCDIPLASPCTIFHGDPFRLRQILANLVSNAVKFTVRGEIVVHAEIAAAVNGFHQIHVSVKDTGIGISLEAQDKIFEQFSQADNSTTRQFGGTGLGLAICRRLIELMAGKIGVKSNPGEGACFWFELSLKAALLTDLPPVVTDISPSQIKVLQGHILLAEDNPVNQQLAQAMLSSFGLTTRVARNGEEALVMAKEEAFALVMMDCNMPRMDGYLATQRWREYEAQQGGTTRLPIIALTANAMEGDRQRCLAAGMDDYLAKPFTRNQLAQVLTRWLPDREENETGTATEALSLEQPPPPAPASDKFSALNLSTLKQLSDLDPGNQAGLVQQILNAYQEISAPLIEQMILSVVEMADAETLRKAAHSLKSASANIGALKLSALLAEFETLGRKNQLEPARERLDRLSSEYNQAMTEIDLYLKGLA